MSRMVHEISSPMEAGHRIELHTLDPSRPRALMKARHPDALVAALQARDRTE